VGGEMRDGTSAGPAGSAPAATLAPQPISFAGPSQAYRRGAMPCRQGTGACDRDRQQLQARATLCAAAAPEEWPAASACHPVSASVRRAMTQAAVRPSLDIVKPFRCASNSSLACLQQLLLAQLLATRHTTVVMSVMSRMNLHSATQKSPKKLLRHAIKIRGRTQNSATVDVSPIGLRKG
jgi:hypothetical protein